MPPLTLNNISKDHKHVEMREKTMINIYINDCSTTNLCAKEEEK